MGLIGGVDVGFKLIALISVILFLILPTNALANGVTEVGAISEEGATAIQNGFETTGYPSAQAAIVIDDELVWAKGFGGQPTLNTIFRTGSVTKTFTAAAFVKLNETGIVGLDDDVSDYLPFMVRNPNEPDTVITIRMVLEHKAGMTTYHQFNQPWISAEMLQLLNDLNYTPSIPVPDWNGVRLPLKEIVNSTNINDSNLWLPSTGTFAYSNTGYFFLSYLLEYITNNTWSDYIHDTILSPLGMNETRFNVTEYGQPIAFPYLELDNGSLVQLPVYRDYGYGAGGMLTTVSDFSKFIITIMNGGWYGDVQVFQPESMPLMNQYLQQYGSMLGYVAEFGKFSTECGKLGVVILGNWDGGNMAPMWSALLTEGQRIVSLNCPTSTTTTTTTSTVTSTTSPTTLPNPGPNDILLMVGLSIAGVVIVIVLFLVMKRRP
jgi:CubicO group peptidase (beta-lactamase class C family)